MLTVAFCDEKIDCGISWQLWNWLSSILWHESECVVFCDTLKWLCGILWHVKLTVWMCAVQEMADLDVDEIMAKQVEQLEKEKKELQERLRGQEKKVTCTAHIFHPLSLAKKSAKYKFQEGCALQLTLRCTKNTLLKKLCCSLTLMCTVLDKLCFVKSQCLCCKIRLEWTPCGSSNDLDPNIYSGSTTCVLCGWVCSCECSLVFVMRRIFKCAEVTMPVL